ncbi:PsiF family protein [Stenotrophomonas sp. YIM B06876]|uniref:PsiF family protein n=1 Tax=Stenotrophomonas sp. YIM B06876 TaxID=3060211 RepID=UPI002739ADEC|nr:PsiF family protein [Stenotrophomonas sp. YIM B06876]
MKPLPFLACLLLTAVIPLAANAATPTAQQQRMAECSAKNKGMKGEAYKEAQRACLSSHPAAAAATTPQQRMTKCNADAGARHLTGDARKSFMSSCLKTH